MDRDTAFRTLMQSPKFYVASSVAILLVLWKLQAWVVLNLRRSRFKRDHGCEEPAQYPNKDPIFGLDMMIENYKASKQHAMLPKIVGRYEKMGANTYGFVLGGSYRIASREPENIKAVLSTHFKSFILGTRRTTILKQFLGDSIFASNGAQWQHSRAFIRPHLTKDSFIDSEMSRFEKHVTRLVAKIPKDGSKVDLQPLFFAFTMDAAIEMLTGKDLQSPEQLALSKNDNIVEMFDNAQKFITYRIIMPFGGLSTKEKASVKRFHDWVDRCVRQAIQEHKSGKVDSEKPCFLQELLSETDDVVRLRSEMIALLIAGRDTTASTLSSLWFVLAKRPDIVAKLKAEVDELGGERPGFSRLKQMDYLQHTIQELLRLYPPVPSAVFEAIEDTFLPVGGGADGKSPVFVAKGQIVQQSVWAVHRRKDIYGPDAETFRPERWEDKSLRPGWGYLPFNGGPRVCIGQQFALTEIAYTVVRMLQEFKAVESRDASPWQENWMTSCSVFTGCQVSMIPYDDVSA